MTFKNILLSKKDRLAQITIHRPKKLNALNKDTIVELSNAFEALEEDTNTKIEKSQKVVDGN